MARGKPNDEIYTGGRPSPYKQEYHDEKVFKLCLLGATDAEIADIFEIAESTLNLWKLKHPSFSESIKSGKHEADSNVARSLYKRATGYEQDTVKVFQFQGDPVIIPVTEHIPPDTGAAMAWLKNRRPKEWRDKQDIELTGKMVVFNGGDESLED